MTDPDGVTHKEIFHTANGKRGLPSRMETKLGSAVQQFTDLAWVSESSSGRPLRPRVTETKICDDRNHNGIYDSGTDKLRKTTVEYTAYASTVQLPWIIKEYNEGGQTVYRTKVTTYINSSNYTSNTRRIIGLPQFSYLYAGDQTTLIAQMEYLYDSANESGTTFLLAHSSQPSQHDSNTNGTAGNYGSNFAYRGNLTKTRRYSVTGGAAGSPIETKIGYFITGNPAWTKDGEDHETSISYDDSFLHYTEPTPGTLNIVTVTPNSATFAYPTKITIDETPTDVISTVSYNYDVGAVTRTVDPKSSANPVTAGIRTYDSKGRLDKALVWKDGQKHSQTRYVYGNDHNYAETWTTINSLSEETFVVHLLDGAGSERITISEHPGSVGGLKLQYQVFDKMRRVIEVSNPTEIDGNWSPAGDDSAGYRYSTQAYDWKGRPTITRLPNHTTSAPRESEINYEGCGCAGNQVVTFYDEGQVDNADPNLRQRRKRQVHYDVFGRPFKTQVYDWNGNVYSTTVNSYNVRNQVLFVKEYSGSATGAENCPTATCQLTEMDYDGHGRLSESERPIESGATTYSYFADDTLQTMTDARGITATYSYNNRKLVTGIDYTEITGLPTSDVTFDYDESGNLTEMNDGPGQVDFTYDSLSRLGTETRKFDDFSSTTYKMIYGYNLAGQLNTLSFKKNEVTDTTVNYNFDKTGRLLDVGGSGFGGITQFISPSLPVKYRAWGAIKQIKYSNGLQTDYEYNLRMQTSRYTLTTVSSGAYGNDYVYYPEGRIKTSLDYTTPTDIDRSFSYDHAGRLLESLTGGEARGGTGTGAYRQTYSYDVWGNLSRPGNLLWNHSLGTDTPTYADNRRQGWGYDEAGNVTSNDGQTHSYDAAGRQAAASGGGFVGGPPPAPIYPVWEIASNNGGNGGYVKRTETRRTQTGSTVNTTATTSYFVRSTLLGGQILVELNDQGNKVKSYVYAAGTRLAKHDLSQPSSSQVLWYLGDPVTGDWGEAKSNGDFVNTKWMDPLGAEVPTGDPYPLDPDPTYVEMRDDEPLYIEGGDPFDYSGGCTLDGLPISCNQFQRLVGSGSVQTETIYGLGDVYSLGGGVIAYDYATGRRRDGEGGWNSLYDYSLFYIPKPQDDGRNGRTDCAWFVDGLVADVRQEREKHLKRDPDVPIDPEYILGLSLALSALPQIDPRNHDQNWTPSGWQDIYVQAPQGGAAYAHVLGQAGGVLIGRWPAPYMRAGAGALTGLGVADAQYNFDRGRLNAAETAFRKAKLGTPEFTNALRDLRERQAEVAADEAGREVGGWLRGGLRGEIEYESLRDLVFNRLCSRRNL